MGNERLTLEVAAKAIGQESIDRLSEALNRFSVSTEKAAVVTRASSVGVGALGESFNHSVPQIAAASAAVRAFEGTLSVRAVERFLTSVLGLGPALQKIFPLIGGLAFLDILYKGGEELVKFYQKWDPVHRAQERAIELAKDLGGEIHKLGEELQKLNFKALEDAFGKTAGKALEGQTQQFNIQGERAMIAAMDADIASLKKTVAESAYSSFRTPDGVLHQTKTLTRTGRAAQIDLDTLQKQRGVQALQLEVDQAKQSEMLRGSLTDQATDISDAAKDAADKAKRAAEKLAEQRKRAQAVSDSEYERTLTGPARVLYSAAQRSKQFDDPQSIRQVTDAGMSEFRSSLQDFSKKGVADSERENAKEIALNEKVFAETLRERIKTGEEAIAADRRVIEVQDAITRQNGAAAAKEATGAANFQSRLISGNSRLDEAQKAAALDQIALDTADKLHDINLATAEGVLDAKEKAKLYNEAELTFEESLQQVKERNIERIADLQNRQLESYRATVGSLFDAAFGGGKGLQSWLIGQAKGIGKTVAENLATEIMPSVEKLIPHAGAGTKLGKILQGTPFGPDPQKTALDANTAATIANTNAMTGGRGTGTGTGAGGTGTDLSQFGSDLTPEERDWLNGGTGNPSKLSGLSGTLGKVLGIAGIGAGAFGAFSDFRSGGAKNDIAGVGAGLGTAAGITAMTGVGAPVAAALGIAAAATTFISALLPDPHKIREDTIVKHLAQAQYIAPEALNVQQDNSGNYIDFDSRGNLRQSSFRAAPQVSEPYLHWHGGYDGTQGFYDVPGRVNSPFAPGPATAPVVNNYINAIDAQSFAQFAQRNSNAIGDATATHLQNVDGRLKAAIQFVAR